MVTRILASTLILMGTLLAAELEVQSSVVGPGHSKETEIRFKAQGSETMGLQFDLGFDADRLKIAAAAGPAATSAGKSVMNSDIGPGRRRFVIVGLNRDVILDGVVVRLTISVNANSKLGDSILSLSDANSTDRDARPSTMKTVGGVVSVVAERAP